MVSAPSLCPSPIHHWSRLQFLTKKPTQIVTTNASSAVCSGPQPDQSCPHTFSALVSSIAVLLMNVTSTLFVPVSHSSFRAKKPAQILLVVLAMSGKISLLKMTGADRGVYRRCCLMNVPRWLFVPMSPPSPSPKHYHSQSCPITHSLIAD